MSQPFTETDSQLIVIIHTKVVNALMKESLEVKERCPGWRDRYARGHPKITLGKPLRLAFAGTTEVAKVGGYQQG